MVRNGFGGCGGTPGPPLRSLPAEIRLRARLRHHWRFYFQPLFWPRFPGRRRWRRVEGAQRAVPARAINRARSAAPCYSRIPSAVLRRRGLPNKVRSSRPGCLSPGRRFSSIRAPRQRILRPSTLSPQARLGWDPRRSGASSRAPRSLPPTRDALEVSCTWCARCSTRCSPRVLAAASMVFERVLSVCLLIARRYHLGRGS